MTPATLKDRRISSLLATMPLVTMAAVAGPEVADSMRTGVRGATAASACGEQAPSPAPSASAAAVRPAAASAVVRVRRGMRMRVIGVSLELGPRALSGCAGGQGFERQRAARGGVVELCLARQHIEARDVEVELRSGETAARVDEL